MQHRRAKFQNKLNQVQLYSLINIIELSLGSSDIIISEKVAEYDHPIECCPKQLQLLVIQWLASQKCIKGINRVEQNVLWLTSRFYDQANKIIIFKRCIQHFCWTLYESDILH